MGWLDWGRAGDGHICVIGLYTFATVAPFVFTVVCSKLSCSFDASKTVSDVGGEAMFCCINGGHEVVACSHFICGLFVILTTSFLEYGYIDVVVLHNLDEDLTLRK